MEKTEKLSKNERIIFCILIAAAAAVRLIGANFNLPNIYTTEEYKIVNYALKMGGGDLNPHFFNYPSLYLYFTLIVSGIYFLAGKFFGVFHSAHEFAVSFFKDPSGIYLTMRLFSGIWSTSTVIVTYFFTKELFGKRTGLITVLFLAFIPSILISSHEIRPNMPSMFLVITAFYLILRFLKEDDYRYFYSAGALIGLATSIYYNAVFLGILMPLVHFFARRGIKAFDFRLWIGLLIMPLLFFAGTPFAVLDFNSFYRDASAHSQGALGNLPTGLGAVALHYLYIGHNIHITPFMGILCYAGIIALLPALKTRRGVILLFFAILLFTVPAAMYFAPGLGYLFPAFPLFLSAGGYLLNAIYLRNKYIFYFLLIVCLTPSVWDSAELIRVFLSEDTRTSAGKWVEDNLENDSKILVDMAAHSPPMKETKRQIERLYRRAEKLNHYKKEYLKLKLETYSENTKGYEIWRIFHAPLEVSGTADVRLVLEAQKTQDLVDISGGWKRVKKLGFKYFIYNNVDEHAAVVSANPALIKFYSEMPRNTELLARFEPRSRIYPTPSVEVRKIK